MNRSNSGTTGSNPAQGIIIWYGLCLCLYVVYGLKPCGGLNLVQMSEELVSDHYYVFDFIIIIIRLLISLYQRVLRKCYIMHTM
jgi:hypothetical protein